jgi:hypothetical protein
MWMKLVAMLALLLVVDSEVALAKTSRFREPTTVASTPAANSASQPKHRRTHRRIRRRHRRHHR